MVLEYIRYRVPLSRQEEFERAWSDAEAALRGASECLAYEVSPEVVRGAEEDLTAEALAALDRRAASIAGRTHLTVLRYRDLRVGNAETGGRPMPRFAAMMPTMAPVAEPGEGLIRVTIEAAPEMRGRVMGLWAVAALGTRPLGGPVTGFAAEHFGARRGLVVGALAVLVIGIPVWWAVSHRGNRREEAETAPAFMPEPLLQPTSAN